MMLNPLNHTPQSASQPPLACLMPQQAVRSRKGCASTLLLFAPEPKYALPFLASKANAFPAISCLGAKKSAPTATFLLFFSCEWLPPPAASSPKSPPSTPTKQPFLPFPNTDRKKD